MRHCQWFFGLKKKTQSNYLRDNAEILRVDATNIKESMEESLKRLNTDYIDLM